MTTRRPPTATLKRVLDWLATQGCAVYGPAVNFDIQAQIGANMDYDLESLLKLAKLNKKYPNGIPEDPDKY